MVSSLLKSLAAVLLGNAIYFLLVMPHVPPSGRHQPFRLDLGLLLDAWLCLFCWGAIEMLSRRLRHRQKRNR